ncbi:hypothetical protein PPACK8108_LOCUS2679 [Phakopsora pachyrhizi]|uniref:Uncharacterized protein n=1 Tax=Phakopsora pachyrhizi TaxID=170000 RepID=A0AAV0AKW0_PHAPC|nr:hypothetical protein PPACK8108_LOCUS2679 [Phakopsora pachyrhizi]
MKLLTILLEAGLRQLAGWQKEAGLGWAGWDRLGWTKAALAYDSSPRKDKTRLKQRITEVILNFGWEKPLLDHRLQARDPEVQQSGQSPDKLEAIGVEGWAALGLF